MRLKYDEKRASVYIDFISMKWSDKSFVEHVYGFDNRRNKKGKERYNSVKKSTIVGFFVAEKIYSTISFFPQRELHEKLIVRLL